MGANRNLLASPCQDRSLELRRPFTPYRPVSTGKVMDRASGSDLLRSRNLCEGPWGRSPTCPVPRRRRLGRSGTCPTWLIQFPQRSKIPARPPDSRTPGWRLLAELDTQREKGLRIERSAYTLDQVCKRASALVRTKFCLAL